jgi:hypothetical protein
LIYAKIVSKLGDLTVIPRVWEKPARGLPKPPHPPTCTVPESDDFYTWRKRLIESWSAESTRRIETPEKGKGGKILRFLNNLITKQYFDVLLSHKDVYSFSSPYCVDKLCSSPICVPGK